MKVMMGHCVSCHTPSILIEGSCLECRARWRQESKGLIGPDEMRVRSSRPRRQSKIPAPLRALFWESLDELGLESVPCCKDPQPLIDGVKSAGLSLLQFLALAHVLRGAKQTERHGAGYPARLLADHFVDRGVFKCVDYAQLRIRRLLVSTSLLHRQTIPRGELYELFPEMPAVSQAFMLFVAPKGEVRLLMATARLGRAL